MARFFAIFACFAVAALSITEVYSIEKLGAEVQVVDSIENFQRNNPDVKLVQLNKSRGARGQILYTIGDRVSGDRLVSGVSDSTSYDRPMDVTLTITYPVSGVGAVISRVEVLVDQSSNVGEGYVTSGGIGQRKIVVVIIARSTTHFSYAGAIFGI